MDNKRWVEENNGYTLYFTPYYEEREVAHIWKDEYGDWLYCSSETRDDNEYLCAANSLQEAKAEAERMIIDHYTDQTNYYTELLEKFEEAPNE